MSILNGPNEGCPEDERGTTLKIKKKKLSKSKIMKFYKM
jgi:hypothetical protein